MLVIFLIVAIVVGASTTALLWSHGLIVALLAASIAASGVVFIVAIVAFKLSSRNAVDGSKVGGFVEWLSRRGNR
jgi:membrane associated rhomboid family serine protease